jgi:hypothetical protein
MTLETMKQKSVLDRNCRQKPAADDVNVRRLKQRMKNKHASFTAAQLRQCFSLLTPRLYMITDAATSVLTPTCDMLVI